MTTYTTIVEDTAGQVFAVRDCIDYPQSWLGIPVKPAPVVGWTPKGRSITERFVRKAGCKVYSRSHTTTT